MQVNDHQESHSRRDHFGLTRTQLNRSEQRNKWLRWRLNLNERISCRVQWRCQTDSTGLQQQQPLEPDGRVKLSSARGSSTRRAVNRTVEWTAWWEQETLQSRLALLSTQNHQTLFTYPVTFHALPLLEAGGGGRQSLMVVFLVLLIFSSLAGWPTTGWVAGKVAKLHLNQASLARQQLTYT